MGKLIMGYWDCPYCGNKGVPGDSGSCPSCGRARGDVTFYMKDHSEDKVREAYERDDLEYIDEEKAEQINRNPDWYCSFCNSLNNDNAKFCTTCGATRQDSEANYFDVQEKLKAKEATKAVPVAAPAPKKRNLLPILLVILAAIIGFTLFMNSNTTGDWSVSDVAWERSINIEKYQEFNESDWTLPADATLTESRREIRSYQQVLDHYDTVAVNRSRQVFDHYDTKYTTESLGNGYFEEVPYQVPVYRTEHYTDYEQRPVYRDEPIYDTKYYYSIWRWKPFRDVTAGNNDHNPAWPEFTLEENEREGERSESYSIQVTQNVKAGKTARTNTWYMKEDDWNNVNPGSGVYITSTRSGSNPTITDESGKTIIAQLYHNP